ncbi:MAG: hypothetical protein GY769_08075 [bacterium]|nr:hypothetical protein [bacterium]
MIELLIAVVLFDFCFSREGAFRAYLYTRRDRRAMRLRRGFYVIRRGKLR